MIGQRKTARDGPRVLAEQFADGVLLAFHVALQCRNLAGRAEDQLLGLSHVEQRGDATLLADLRQVQ